MRILGIESSCDETAVAVLECSGERDFKILSNEVASQIQVHARYGGVVPEIASRAHCETITNLVKTALNNASVNPKELDAVAVTAFPGLIGALLVGVNFAKGFAYQNNLPLYAVDHIKGHIASNYLTNDLRPPFIAFVASGGHTSIILVEDYRKHTVIGGTRDDAMGEAFDKIARVMGMPYPGGAAMDKLSYEGKNPVKFPSAAIKDDTLDFSFSGIKTAALNYINSSNQKGEEFNKADIAAGFTKAAVESVIVKLGEAFKRYPNIKTIALAGGVAANSHLRNALVEFSKKHKLKLFMPELKYCGDNGAMIAAAGYFEYLSGEKAELNLNAEASRFEE
jgi:N6-L-threonylcarbamoyladenine synthase